MNTQLTRVPVPVDLLRKIDRFVEDEAKAYESRDAFIVDSIRERILELEHESAEEPSVPAAKATETRTVPKASSRSRQSTLEWPAPGTYVLSESENIALPARELQFGMHNRDYPSIWSLTQLCGLASNEAILLDEFFEEIIARAWEFGEFLGSMKSPTGQKYDALFPTNREKTKAAENRFRSFAIGEPRQNEAARKKGKIATAGPLFSWGVAGLARVDGGARLKIGPTKHGRELLDSLGQIDVQEPHSKASSSAFLEHLDKHDPEDFQGFLDVLGSIGATGVNRGGLQKSLTKRWKRFGLNTNQMSTNAAGYVARCREWGLVELKQVQGKYQLTDFGRERIS